MNKAERIYYRNEKGLDRHKSSPGIFPIVGSKYLSNLKICLFNFIYLVDYCENPNFSAF